MCIFNIEAEAQAFDGFAHGKTLGGYTQVAKNRGIVFTRDAGINNYLSYNFSVIVVSSERNGDLPSNVNLSSGLRFHFIELIPYGEENDFYTGVDLGLATSGVHAGYLRMFTDKIGVSVEAHYGILKEAFGIIDLQSSYDNLFHKKIRFSINFVWSHLN